MLNRFRSDLEANDAFKSRDRYPEALPMKGIVVGRFALLRLPVDK